MTQLSQDDQTGGSKGMSPRIPDDRIRGCCTWATFRDGFIEAYAKWFELAPSAAVWKAAMRDWHLGNTGWEAAHNAQRRAKDQVAKANRPKLVHLGGRNYALEGSALARRFGRPAEVPLPTDAQVRDQDELFGCLPEGER